MNDINSKKKGLILPHNLPNGQKLIYKIKKMADTAIELGGTVYEIAEESGFLSAVEYMELHFGEKAVDEDQYSEDITVVTEVYVPLNGMEELTRIFLYSEDASLDAELIKEGKIEDGRLVIEQKEIHKLCDSGFHKISDYKFWKSDVVFAENGFRQGLLVKTRYETVIVMPDFYSVEESLRVVEAEARIRERYDPGFCIEKINYPGETGSYRRLASQISFIRNFYPKVYELVWSKGEIFEEETKEFTFDIPDAIISINIGEHSSLGVCMTEDGRIRRIPDINCAKDTPDNLKYTFDGCGDILNAGVAFSKMALIMKAMYQAAELVLDVNVTKAVITFSGRIPGKEEITKAMLERKSTRLDLLAYEEIKSDHLDGRGLIVKAAGLAKLPETEIADPAVSIAAAYEAYARDGMLSLGEIALIYDLGEEYFTASLIQKNQDVRFEKIGEQLICFPKLSDMKNAADSFSVTLDQDMREFMLAQGLRAIGITGKREADRKAFEELTDSIPRVKRQFTRNDCAKLIFHNGYLEMTEDYPVERFEKCYRTVYKKTREAMMQLFSETGFALEDVSKIFLAGAESRYPFLWKDIEEYTGKKVCIIDHLECAAAKGAVISLPL